MIGRKAKVRRSF
ncbi:hypothetical protein M0802_016895 [Mischocyttarus mexicanus]|nr:hypothetical protein M0802_016895 [Mischocyttarus mexicanus]